MGWSSQGHIREKVVSAGTARRRVGAGTLWVWPVRLHRVAVRNREAVVRRNQPAEARAGNTRRSGEEHHTARVVGNEPEHHRAVEGVRRTAPAAARAVVVHILVVVAGRRCIEHEAEVHHMGVVDDAAEEEAVGNIRLPVVEVALRGPRSAVKTCSCNCTFLFTYGHKAGSLGKTLWARLPTQ